MIGGRAGGIVLQIRDGQDGYLVDSIEECAAPHDRAARRSRQGRRHGRVSGQEHVRQNFLSTRELEDWLTLFGTLQLGRARVIVVSNRGRSGSPGTRTAPSRPTAAPAAS